MQKYATALFAKIIVSDGPRLPQRGMVVLTVGTDRLFLYGFPPAIYLPYLTTGIVP